VQPKATNPYHYVQEPDIVTSKKGYPRGAKNKSHHADNSTCRDPPRFELITTSDGIGGHSGRAREYTATGTAAPTAYLLESSKSTAVSVCDLVSIQAI
jgi:hypothetical protein